MFSRISTNLKTAKQLSAVLKALSASYVGLSYIQNEKGFVIFFQNIFTIKKEEIQKYLTDVNPEFQVLNCDEVQLLPENAAFYRNDLFKKFLDFQIPEEKEWKLVMTSCAARLSSITKRYADRLKHLKDSNPKNIFASTPTVIRDEKSKTPNLFDKILKNNIDFIGLYAAKEKIDAREFKMEIDLVKEEKAAYYDTLLGQESTLTKFFELVDDSRASKIKSDEIYSTWLSCFHQHQPQRTNCEAKDEKDFGVLLRLKSCVIERQYQSTEVADLRTDIELFTDQVKYVLGDQFELESKVIDLSKKEFSVLIRFKVAPHLVDQFIIDLNKILIRAALENAYDLNTVTFIMKPELQKASAFGQFGSPVMVAGQAHESLVKELDALNYNKQRFLPFTKLIAEKKYSKAFRTLCTDSTSYAAVEVMLKYRQALNIDIHEKGSNNQMAIHHAAYRGVRDVYDLLVKNGAKVNVVDNFGVTAENYLQFAALKKAKVR